MIGFSSILLIDMDLRNTDWQINAECKKADPELFFPSGEKGKLTIEQIQQAKEFCVRCLVREQCLEYALGNGENDGVWGGKTKRERKQMKRAAGRYR
jgi:WhiB family redox-sensing transcriptional regulator